MSDKLEYCIKYLADYNHVRIPYQFEGFDCLRALMNITMPYNLSDEYYQKQDAAIKEYYEKKTIVDVDDLPFITDRICIYKGDITLLKADAIVNACNEKLLGCFSPLHSCIDNAIHSFAGLEVRRDLMEVMEKQGHDEPNGKCKVTKGYNLPSSYIFHTVGPKAFYRVSKENENDLRNCYISCLKKAEEMNLHSIVFCSISTGVYGYPIFKASRTAVETVKEFLKENNSIKRVIFNVFSERDYDEYQCAVKETY